MVRLARTTWIFKIDVIFMSPYTLKRERVNYKTLLKPVTLNVGGLRSKIICPESISHINQFDILGLQETKTDSIDDIKLHDHI